MRALTTTALMLLAAVGCGKMDSGIVGNGTVGSTRSFVSSVATPEQQTQVQTLCGRLQQKDTNYVYYVNGYTRFNYETTTRACDGSTSTATVTPTLSSSGGLLQFVIPAGQSLATSVETATSGKVSQLCRALSGLGYPLQTSATTAVWYRIFTGSECPSSDPDVQCVALETATKQTNGSYVVTSTDKFFFDFSAGQDSGTVIRHEAFEQGGCETGKSVMRTSVYRGMN